MLMFAFLNMIEQNGRNIDNCVNYMTFSTQLSICPTAINCHQTNAVVHNRKNLDMQKVLTKN